MNHAVRNIIIAAMAELRVVKEFTEKYQDGNIKEQT
jgi:hypothetical protein